MRIKQSNGQVKVIGYVDGDIFIAYRMESKHLYRCGRCSVEEAREQDVAAWGVDAIAVRHMLRRNIRTLKIVSDKATYTAPLVLFEKKGFSQNFFPHGEQLMLYEKEFTKTVTSSEDRRQWKRWRSGRS